MGPQLGPPPAAALQVCGALLPRLRALRAAPLVAVAPPLTHHLVWRRMDVAARCRQGRRGLEGRVGGPRRAPSRQAGDPAAALAGIISGLDLRRLSPLPTTPRTSWPDFLLRCTAEMK